MVAHYDMLSTIQASSEKCIFWFYKASFKASFLSFFVSSFVSLSSITFWLLLQGGGGGGFIKGRAPGKLTVNETWPSICPAVFVFSSYFLS